MASCHLGNGDEVEMFTNLAFKNFVVKAVLRRLYSDEVLCVVGSSW